MKDLLRVWRPAVTCELCWLPEAGPPRTVAAVPLLDGDTPCLALPYAHAELVESLRTVESVSVTVTDPRSVPAGAGVAVTGRFTMFDDTEGEFFTAGLLEQELLKHPPSRVLADSRLLRKENWWWLGRIIVELERPDRVVDVPTRSDPARDALLIRPSSSADPASAPEFSVVTADGGWDAPRVRLRPAAGASIPGDSGLVTAFGHDYSVPDFERWESWTVNGELRDAELVVTDREGEPGKGLSALGLGDRLRRHRSLERACRRGIERAERRRGR